MTLSMYEASVPQFIKGLDNLAAIIGKAETYAESKKIEPGVLVNARLAPDMFPLSRQVQIATDMVKGCAARLAGVEVPSYEDKEVTFPELKERISKTVAFLKTLKPAQIDGSEEKEVKLGLGKKEMVFKGKPYLFDFVIPNFYFHMMAVYAILRHNGQDLGKADFIGGL